MHYYQHNIKTFNNATRHLTRVERALYRDLIEIYYDTEEPLTADINRLSRLVMANSDDEKDALEYVLSEFFVFLNGAYRHEYCDETIAAYRANKSAKSMAGIASAEARKAKAKLLKKTKSKQNSTGVKQAFNECATNKEPVTNNHKPATSNQGKDAARLIFADYGFTDQQINLIYETRARNTKTSKSAKITDKIAESLCKSMSECINAGYTIDQVLSEWHESTWVTFKPDWIKNRIPVNKTPPKGQQSKEFQDWINQGDVIEHGGIDHERIG